jgi:hypothetical protein
LRRDVGRHGRQARERHRENPLRHIHQRTSEGRCLKF